MSECSHTNNTTEHGLTVCTDCGEEVSIRLCYEKQTRECGQIENIENNTVSKEVIRKIDEKSIFADIDKLGITDGCVLADINRLYLAVTDGQIRRGTSRKSIILGCIKLVFQRRGNMQDPMKYIDILGLSKRIALKGIKTVSLRAPKEPMIETDLTPNIIVNIMDKFQASETHKNQVVELYNSVRNKSSKLNRARPHSVASGLIFYWIQKNEKQIGLKEFSKQVALSDLTICKVMKEIQIILGD